MLKHLLLAACLTFTSLSAEIIETMHLEETRRFLTPDTLVIFDIDNTLMVPAQQLGSDQWFHHRLDLHLEAKMSFEDALEQALAEWYSVQNVTHVLEAEPGAAKFVQKLQNDGFTVMGLTSRGLGLSTRTILQLRSIGIDLSVTSPTKDELHFINKKGVLFRRGILFTAGTHKGTAFAKLMERIQMRPKAVVFINDKASHLAPVEEICAELGIPFIGLRYGFTDAMVAEFDPAVAGLQYSHFGHIMSDEEARSLLQ